MHTIFCSNPVIILNPRFSEFAIRFKATCIHGHLHVFSVHELDWMKFKSDWPRGIYSAKKMGVNARNLDEFLICDPDTGESVPMFIQVPCGHCVLCRDKKAREWSFRAACENWASTSEPLFVTLTYSNDNLPLRGVQKRDLQLFMKRLRINLFRKIGSVCSNLRYFACAEYGTRSKRAHYHIILWNFPQDFYYFPTLSSKLEFIESSWDLGFCYCVPLRKGGVSYVMKYMRKPCDVPLMCNPVFFLSSRRHGGIGAAYARYMSTWYRENPDAVEIQVFDPYENKTHICSIPVYFKDIFFPRYSSLVPKEIRDLCTEFNKRIVLRRSVHFHHFPDDPFPLADDEREIYEKYSSVISIPSSSTNLKDPLFFPYDVLDRDKYYENEQRLSELVYILSSYKMDMSYIRDMQEKRKQNADSVSLFYKDKPEINVEEIAWQKSYKLNQQIYREKL